MSNIDAKSVYTQLGVLYLTLPYFAVVLFSFRSFRLTEWAYYKMLLLFIRFRWYCTRFDAWFRISRTFSFQTFHGLRPSYIRWNSITLLSSFDTAKKFFFHFHLLRRRYSFSFKSTHFLHYGMLSKEMEHFITKLFARNYGSWFFFLTDDFWIYQ